MIVSVQSPIAFSPKWSVNSWAKLFKSTSTTVPSGLVNATTNSLMSGWLIVASSTIQLMIADTGTLMMKSAVPGVTSGITSLMSSNVGPPVKVLVTIDIDQETSVSGSVPSTESVIWKVQTPNATSPSKSSANGTEKPPPLGGSGTFTTVPVGLVKVAVKPVVSPTVRLTFKVTSSTGFGMVISDTSAWLVTCPTTASGIGPP